MGDDYENVDNEYGNEAEGNQEEDIMDDTGEGVEGEGEQPEWAKKFKTPDDIYKSYKNLQAEYTRLRQRQKASENENIDIDNIDIEEPENPENVLEDLIQQNIDKKIGNVVEYVNEQRINYVISQVEQIFPDFDIEKNQEAISRELEKFKDEYKQKHPVEAMVQAIANIKGIDVGNSNSNMVDKFKNFSESSSNRKPPQKVDEVDLIINSGKNSLPF